MGDHPIIQKTVHKVHNRTEARDAILVIMALAVGEKEDGVYSLDVRELGEKEKFNLIFSPDISLKHTIRLVRDIAGPIIKSLFKYRSEFVLQLVVTRIDQRKEVTPGNWK